MGEVRNAYEILIGKSKLTAFLWRPMRIQDEYINIRRMKKIYGFVQFGVETVVFGFRNSQCLGGLADRPVGSQGGFFPFS
jgi:hypothetical protein